MEKGKKQILSDGPQDAGSANTLILAQWYWFWMSDLQDCEGIKFCGFKKFQVAT